MTERTEEERIDDPRTADDYLLAAQAWASDRRSHWNMIYAVGDGGVPGAVAEALTAQADAAKAQSLTAIATALMAREAMGQLAAAATPNYTELDDEEKILRLHQFAVNLGAGDGGEAPTSVEVRAETLNLEAAGYRLVKVAER